MRPSAHLITAVPLAAGAYAISRSPALAAGVFVGAFLIDLDHYFDFVVIHRGNGFGPRAFLRYYGEHRYDRLVLGLHGYEQMAALLGLGLLFPHPALTGYLIGAAFHLTLDVIFNGRMTLSPLLFYSFIHRARRGFRKTELMKPEFANAGAGERGTQ